jgi:hypothetical protein
MAAVPARAGTVDHPQDDNVPGSLRYELTTGATDGEVITINAGVDPVLTGPEIQVVANFLTLRGQGMNQTTISRTGNVVDRILEVSPAVNPVTFGVYDLEITGGHAPAGIPGQNLGDHGGPGFDGGAINFAGGQLLVDSVRFTANRAGDGAGGNANILSGVGGKGGDGGEGGAISLAGSASAEITNSVFDSNLAGNGGDGGAGGDAVSVPGAGGKGGNGGIGGFGGAIEDFSGGNISIVDSYFTGNRSGTGGKGAAGGSGSTEGASGNGGDGGRGGAIEGSGLVVTGSAFSGNAAGAGGKGGPATTHGGGTGGQGGRGGGVSSTQALTLTNSTFSGNSSGDGGQSGTLGGGSLGGAGGDGSAVYADQPAPSTLNALTVSGNVAGNAGGGDPGGSYGTGAVAGAFTIRNSIVVNNAGAVPSVTEVNCSGAPGAITYGIILSFPADSGCPGATGDPQLGPLQDNGGPTPTMAIGPGSLALDRIPPSGFDCLPTDQRSVPRPQLASCDVGAFEYEPPPPPENADVDTTLPDTTITKKPKDQTKKKTAKFEFSSSEPGSTFECSLDDGPFEPCTSPQSEKVGKGKHRFEVRAIDPAGNIDASAAADTWKLKKKKK